MFSLFKGPIVAQQEDEPADPGATQEDAEPEFDPLAPSESDIHGQGSLRATRTRQTIRNSLVSDPSSVAITAIQIQARPALAEGSQVRNRLTRSLRGASGNVPRDGEGGPQVPEDALRIGSPQETQHPHRGRQTSRRPQTGTYKWTWTESSSRL